MRQRDSLRRSLLKDPNNDILKDSYKSCRNSVIKLIKQTKSNYYKQKILEAKKDCKKTWKLINESTNSIPTKKHINEIKRENDDTHITNTIEVCSRFNYFFTEIGRKMQTQLLRRDILPKRVMITSVCSLFFCLQSPNRKL